MAKGKKGRMCLCAFHRQTGATHILLTVDLRELRRLIPRDLDSERNKTVWIQMSRLRSSKQQQNTPTNHPTVREQPWKWLTSVPAAQCSECSWRRPHALICGSRWLHGYPGYWQSEREQSHQSPCPGGTIWLNNQQRNRALPNRPELQHTPAKAKAL